MESRACCSLALLLLPFLFSSFSTHTSIATDTISPGHILSGNQTLISSGGHFELGFFSPPNSANYYIGIWYKKIPTKTIIWVANRETPISNPSSAQLKISEDGHLVLANGSKTLIWSSSSTSNTSVTILAVLLDTGNLVLRNGSNSSTPLWQSFDHPTDTWMPGGWLSVNKITGEYQSITSWKNTEDPAAGPFAESMDPDGTNQYVVLWKGTQIYWSSGLWNGQFFSDVPSTAEKTAFNFTFVDGKDRKYAMYTITDPSVITRCVVDPLGQIKQWWWQNSSQQWISVFTQPIAQCDVYSLCGVFGICDQNSGSLCRCPVGFEPALRQHWDMNDWAAGCVRKTQLQCNINGSINGGGGADRFLMLPSVRLPSNPQTLKARNSKECELACLNNCSCIAYSYSTGCLAWNGDLRNLRQLYSGDSNPATLYLRIAASDFPRSIGSHKSVVAVIVSTIAGVVLAIFILLGLICLRWRKRTRMAKLVEGSLISFTYADLQRMTKSFSEKLGGGGFGSVFKGTMSDSTVIAVKKLEGLNQGEKQFRAEVSTLGAIQHVNLVHLRGFCCERNKRLLVYDYMSGGSLDSHLFKDTSTVLDWKMRYQIMLGVGRGLAYLHEECRECIIHCDIKPDNILLDAEFRPKVADFGMAKLIGHDFSRVLTTMRGTVGYLAPEWISGLPITPKVDVYSFGMMLFELLSGQRNARPSEDGCKTFFPSWASSRVIEGNVLSLLDPRLKGEADIEELTRVCRVAFWCIQDSETQRPTMKQVVHILEGVLEVNMPPVPATLLHLMEAEAPLTYKLPSNQYQASSETSQSSERK